MQGRNLPKDRILYNSIHILFGRNVSKQYEEKNKQPDSQLDKVTFHHWCIIQLPALCYFIVHVLLRISAYHTGMPPVNNFNIQTTLTVYRIKNMKANLICGKSLNNIKSNFLAFFRILF